MKQFGIRRMKSLGQGMSGPWVPEARDHTFSLALGPAQGGFVATGQGQVRLVVVGGILAAVQPQAPFGAPGL